MNPSSNDFLIALKVLTFLLNVQKREYEKAEMYKDADKMAKATKLIDKILTIKCNVIDNYPTK